MKNFSEYLMENLNFDANETDLLIALDYIADNKENLSKEWWENFKDKFLELQNKQSRLLNILYKKSKDKDLDFEDMFIAFINTIIHPTDNIDDIKYHFEEMKKNSANISKLQPLIEEANKMVEFLEKFLPRYLQYFLYFYNKN